MNESTRMDLLEMASDERKRFFEEQEARRQKNMSKFEKEFEAARDRVLKKHGLIDEVMIDPLGPVLDTTGAWKEMLGWLERQSSLWGWKLRGFENGGHKFDDCPYNQHKTWPEVIQFDQGKYVSLGWL